MNSELKVVVISQNHTKAFIKNLTAENPNVKVIKTLINLKSDALQFVLKKDTKLVFINIDDFSEDISNIKKNLSVKNVLFIAFALNSNIALASSLGYDDFVSIPAPFRIIENKLEMWNKGEFSLTEEEHNSYSELYSLNSKTNEHIEAAVIENKLNNMPGQKIAVKKSEPKEDAIHESSLKFSYPTKELEEKLTDKQIDEAEKLLNSYDKDVVFDIKVVQQYLFQKEQSDKKELAKEDLTRQTDLNDVVNGIENKKKIKTSFSQIKLKKPVLENNPSLAISSQKDEKVAESEDKPSTSSETVSSTDKLSKNTNNANTPLDTSEEINHKQTIDSNQKNVSDNDKEHEKDKPKKILEDSGKLSASTTTEGKKDKVILVSPNSVVFKDTKDELQENQTMDSSKENIDMPIEDPFGQDKDKKTNDKQENETIEKPETVGDNSGFWSGILRIFNRQR